MHALAFPNVPASPTGLPCPLRPARGLITTQEVSA